MGPHNTRQPDLKYLYRRTLWEVRFKAAIYNTTKGSLGGIHGKRSQNQEEKEAEKEQ